MVGNVTIQGQIVGTATFDGAKISAVVTIAPPINATVVFGKSGVTVHNELTGRDAADVHPIASITGLTAALATIPELVSEVFSIDGRVSSLEDNVIVDVLLLSDVASVSITVDKNGNPINISDCSNIDVIVTGGTTTANVNVWLRLNNISSASYIQTGSLTGFQGIGNFFWNQKFELSICKKSILCLHSIQRANFDYSSMAQNVYTMSTKENSIPIPINRFDLVAASGNIKAGTRILILRK